MCGPLAPANVDYARAECYKYDPRPARRPSFKEAGVDPTKLQLTLDTPSGRYPLDKERLARHRPAQELQRLGIKTNVAGQRVGHAPWTRSRPEHRRHVLFSAGARRSTARRRLHPLFLADQTYSSVTATTRHRRRQDRARAQTLLEPKARARERVRRAAAPAFA